LDPSCGSGNFLINIITEILNSDNSQVLKLKAISNVYGLDINPLAIITARVNILLVLLDSYDIEDENFPQINVLLCDALFPDNVKTNKEENLSKMLNSFDLVIGNPPWLTYKDLFDKDYQKRIRDLSDELMIKPSSQYITHIELAAVFFYAIPVNFLKKNGTIFFVMPKSVLNGDHCTKFRAFSIFNKELEIWDFPQNYFFNVNHICLKGEYIGLKNSVLIGSRYPIKTKIFDDKLEITKETLYSSLSIERDGAKLILPIDKLKRSNQVDSSPYKKKFYQGATLVPRSLVFFQISEEKKDLLVISTDPDVLSRSKKKWEFSFQNREIEKVFQFKTFLNRDLIPFHIKILKDVFLPINDRFEFDLDYLKRYPKGYGFYNEVNDFYRKMKKETSSIATLYENLNYWNKLQKQLNHQAYTMVYNASGSNLKAAVISNENQTIIVGSENYYYSTNSEEEAYYLSAILNSPELSKNIKLVKSSRHIHKRPFMYPIPIYDKNNPIHRKLAKKGETCHGLVYELALKNPKITSEKVRILINRKLMKIKDLVAEIVFN
ncbi:MAG: Eco57I restriction-modification methylase domain-containing protein, partial [Promethearchaeota archaeon]